MQIHPYHKPGKPGMVRVWILACLVLITSLAQAAPAPGALWSKANAFYTEKQYDSAAAVYNQLLQQFPDNVSLHYNLGNTYYRLNKVGPAILHYARASRLDPGNKEIKDNLVLAKGRVQNPLPEADPIFFVRWWNDFLHWLGPNTWAALTLLAFCSVLALVYFARVRQEKFAHSGRWLSLSLVALMVCGCMLYFTYYARTGSNKAVVMQASVNLMDAPKASGKVLGSLSEGTLVEIYSEEGNYINVKLPNGREGWIMAGTIDKV